LAGAPSPERVERRRFFLQGVADGLLAAARTVFRLDAPHGKGGATVREHLEALERRTGERPKELDECEIPDGASHVWQWFLELNAARTGNGYGPNPITYSEIRAWMVLKGVAVRAFEVDLIRALDTAYLEAYAEREGK